jgi:hypothetical protein
VYQARNVRNKDGLICSRLSSAVTGKYLDYLRTKNLLPKEGLYSRG